MKTTTKIFFLAVCAALVFPHITLSMKNYCDFNNGSFIPSVKLTTSGESVVVIKNNRFALKEKKCVRVWNLDVLSIKNKKPSHEYNLSPTYGSQTINTEEYRFIDLDDNGVQLLVYDHFSWIDNRVFIYDVSTKLHSCYAMDVDNAIGTAKFFDAGTVVMADRNAIYMRQLKENKSTNIPMPIRQFNMSKDLSSIFFLNTPIVAVHQATKKFVCCVDIYYEEEGLKGGLSNGAYLFTNHNYRHSCFVFLILRQFLGEDMAYEIASRIQSSAIQCIDIGAIRDSIIWMEYSPDGSTIALTGVISNYLCKPQEVDGKGKNCITPMPIAGFSTFYPNNKTIFVMAYTGKALFGIDLRTKKIIYEHKLVDKMIIDSIQGEQNQLLAFNKKGDKLAVAFYKHCQLYDVPESLQNFLNTYDPETVPEIMIEPEKKVTIISTLENKRKKSDNCVVQ